jgi:threonine/homoserine/homoserine lactone efflux protein
MEIHFIKRHSAMIESLWGFLGISVLVICTPGPDTAITVRNTLMGGRRAGIATGLGVSTGQMVWALATSLGLVALLLASEPVFQAVKLAGALYLIWLGFQALRGALRPGGQIAATPRWRLGAAAAFRQGLINDLANPKMAAFFASVLPQFAPAGQGMLSALLLLGAIFAGLTFGWLALYAVAVAAAGDQLRRSGLRRWIEGVTGAVLVGLGLRLAAEQR